MGRRLNWAGGDWLRVSDDEQEVLAPSLWVRHLHGEPEYRGGEEEKSSRMLGHETSKFVEWMIWLQNKSFLWWTLVAWSWLYPGLSHPILEAKGKDGIYMNKERLHQQQRVQDPFCTYKACRKEELVESVEHIFCLCYRVRTTWHTAVDQRVSAPVILWTESPNCHLKCRNTKLLQ